MWIQKMPCNSRGAILNNASNILLIKETIKVSESMSVFLSKVVLLTDFSSQS